MSKKYTEILINIIEFINACANFNQRMFLTFIILLSPLTYNIKIICFIVALIFNIFIDWGYWKLKDREYKLKKDEFFKELYDWFEEREDIEISEIIDLMRVMMEPYYNYNSHCLIVEFKKYKKDVIKWHNKINELLKDMDTFYKFDFLEPYEFENGYEVIKYINENIENDKKLYLESKIRILIKCIRDKNLKIYEINTIKKDNKKSYIVTTILAIVSILLTLLLSDNINEIFNIAWIVK